ncbi:hypothetical protein [Bradyrhizobium acaciae]|nr:hypothetical protein [Bradyrhizobium acaciae]
MKLERNDRIKDDVTNTLLFRRRLATVAAALCDNEIEARART